MHVLVIEDHPITALGFKMLIEEGFEDAVVDIASNGKMAVEAIRQKSYHLISLDLTLPQTDTETLMVFIKNNAPSAAVVICSSHSAALYAMPYLSMGASGYIHKSAPKHETLNALKTILSGQIYVQKDVFKPQLNGTSPKYNLNPKFSTILSARELEFLKHLLEGERIADISKIMNIHQSTASTLKKRIFEKANVDNIIDLLKKTNEQ